MIAIGKLILAISITSLLSMIGISMGISPKEMFVNSFPVCCMVWMVIDIIHSHRQTKQYMLETDSFFKEMFEKVDVLVSSKRKVEDQNRELVEFVESLVEDQTCDSRIRSRAKLLHKKVTEEL